MAVARASSAESIRTGTEDPYTFVFTPAGTPRGILIAIVNGFGGSVTTSLDYGGVPLTNVISAEDTVTETGRASFWFVGSGIPTGAQTITHDLTSAIADDIHYVVWELSGSADLEVIDSDLLQENQANPVVTLQKGGKTAICIAAMYGGGAAPGGTLQTGNTLDHTHDLGNFYSQTCFETTVDNADHTIGWSSLATDDLAFVAVAISEMAASPATVTPAAIAPTVSLPGPQPSIPATVTPAVLALTGAAGYVALVDQSGSKVSSPDHTSFAITGDIDIRAWVTADSWTPTATKRIISQRDSASDRAYSFYLALTTGKLGLNWSVDGTGPGSAPSQESSVGTGFTDGTGHWVRVTLDAVSGANHDVTFYTSDDPVGTDPAAVTWTQLGTVRTGTGNTSIFNSTQPVDIGHVSDGGRWAGRFAYGEIRNGIDGTIVANPDFRDADQITTPNTVFTDSQGRVWTINSPAAWVANLPGLVLPIPTIVVTNPPVVVTPAAIAPTVALPTALVSVPIVVTPAAVAPTVALPLPTAKAASTVTPSAIGLSVTHNTPTVLAASRVTPAAVAPSLTHNTPTISAGARVTPSPIAPAVTLPQAQAGVSAIALPGVLALSVTHNTPNALAAATVTPGAVAPTVALPTPAIAIAATVQPNPVAPTVSFPTPAILAASRVTPGAVAPTVSLPIPTVITGAGVIATPAAIALSVTHNTPAVTVPATVAPAAVAPTVSLPTSSTLAASRTTPAAIAPIVALPLPTAGVGATVTPGVIGLTVSHNTPAIQAAATTAPNPITLTVGLDDPSLMAGVVIAPNGITLTINFPATSAIVGIVPFWTRDPASFTRTPTDFDLAPVGFTRIRGEDDSPW